MKKRLPHTITVQNLVKDGIQTGANTKILLDGKPLKFCKSFKLTLEASKVSVVTLELFANVDIEEFVIGKLTKTTCKNGSVQPRRKKKKFQHRRGKWQVQND